MIDTHSAVSAFVKNVGLALASPYLANGEPHEYEPDFVIRLARVDNHFDDQRIRRKG